MRRPTLFLRALPLLALVFVLVPQAFAASPDVKINGFRLAQLTDVRLGHTKAGLRAQIKHSTDVLAFYKQSFGAKVTHCRGAVERPYFVSCARMRSTVRAHDWLRKAAQRRLHLKLMAEARAKHRTLAHVHYVPVSGSVPQMICQVFAEDCGGALAVARCESGYSTGAANGQYLGIFQMGSSERATYATLGYASAYAQIVAAHNYYVAAHGWGPWSCRP